MKNAALRVCTPFRGYILIIPPKIAACKNLFSFATLHTVSGSLVVDSLEKLGIVGR
jgi:hypothetical protein